MFVSGGELVTETMLLCSAFPLPRSSWVLCGLKTLSTNHAQLQPRAESTLATWLSGSVFQLASPGWKAKADQGACKDNFTLLQTLNIRKELAGLWRGPRSSACSLVGLGEGHLGRAVTWRGRVVPRSTSACPPGAGGIGPAACILQSMKELCSRLILAGESTWSLSQHIECDTLPGCLTHDQHVPPPQAGCHLCGSLALELAVYGQACIGLGSW